MTTPQSPLEPGRGDDLARQERMARLEQAIASCDWHIKEIKADPLGVDQMALGGAIASRNRHRTELSRLRNEGGGDPTRCPIGIKPDERSICSAGTCYWCLRDRLASPSDLPAREAIERAPAQTARNDDEILKILAMAADGPPGDGGANALDSSRAGPRPISSNNRCSWGVALSAIREVVRAAWELCDDTANENPPEVPQTSWDKLAGALERLEQLIPESEQPASAGHVVTLLIAALQPRSQGNGAEPVAWRVRAIGPTGWKGSWFVVGKVDERLKHHEYVPLYAAPPSPPEGVREALVTTTICGSTRYPEQHISASGYLTLYEGRVVFLCSMLRVSGVTTEQAERFDLIHKEKIRRSDEILVLDDYVGDSTRSEIEFANNLGKKVRYLSSEPAMAEWVRSNTLSPGLVEAAEWQFGIENAPKDADWILVCGPKWNGPSLAYFSDIADENCWIEMPSGERLDETADRWMLVPSWETPRTLSAKPTAIAADREGDRDA